MIAAAAAASATMGSANSSKATIAVKCIIQLLLSAGFWTIAYLWFFKSLHIIDAFVQYSAKVEVATYVALSVVPILLIRLGIVKKSVVAPLENLAQLVPDPVLAHSIKQLTKPLASALESLLIFLSVNLLAQSVPEGFSFTLPGQLAMLDPNGDGELTASEIEGEVAMFSTGLLKAVLVSCFSWWIMRLKDPPDDGVEDVRGAIGSYWRSLLKRRFVIVMLHLGLSFGAIVIAALQWFAFVGLSPQTVLTFGGIGGLAFGLASQNLVANFICGLLLLLSRPFTVGEVVSIAGVTGKVIDISWSTTKVWTPQAIVSIPNSNVLGAAAVNQSRQEDRAVVFRFPVRFPVGKFKDIKILLSDLSQHLEQVELNNSKVTRLPEVTFGGIDAENTEPLANIEVKVFVDNSKIGGGPLNGAKSQLSIAAFVFCQERGLELPGLETGSA